MSNGVSRRSNISDSGKPVQAKGEGAGACLTCLGNPDSVSSCTA